MLLRQGKDVIKHLSYAHWSERSTFRASRTTAHTTSHAACHAGSTRTSHSGMRLCMYVRHRISLQPYRKGLRFRSLPGEKLPVQHRGSPTDPVGLASAARHRATFRLPWHGPSLRLALSCPCETGRGLRGHLRPRLARWCPCAIRSCSAASAMILH